MCKGWVRMKKWVSFLFVLLCFPIFALADDLTLTFSHVTGFYPESLTLEMQCDNPDAVIHYTLDGSVPDENSPVYLGGLTLPSSNMREDTLMKITGITAGEAFVPTDDFPTAHVVRAIALTKDDSSAVVSGTYFVGYDRAELYGDIAIMCLVTDPDNLFDYDTGIYVNGHVYDEWLATQTGNVESWQVTANFTQRGKEWERPVSVTFLPAAGDGFTQDMGMRIKGGASRGNNQKSLRLIARKEYGEKRVDYALYPDNLREDGEGIVSKYKSFTLRCGGNDTDFGKIRDPYIANLSTGLRFQTAQNMACLAFINGEYWGLYTLNEEYSDSFFQYHYGIDDKEIVVVKCSQLDEGQEDDIGLYHQMYQTIAFGNMTDPDAYAAACELLDMGSFADYCAVQLYILNSDGIFQNNNWQMWRTRTVSDASPYADGKWRMMLYDTDFSSGVYSSGDGADTDNVLPAITDAYYPWHPALLFSSLIQNEDFQQTFITACCDVRNLYFSKKRAVATLADMTAEYLPYRPDTLRRFGPAWTLWNPENHCKTNMSAIGHFFEDRYGKFLGLVKNAFELNSSYTITVKISDKSKGKVFVNGRDIEVTSGMKLQYFGEYPLEVMAVAEDGARFIGWEVSSDYAQVADIDAAETTVRFSRSFTLTANFE